MESNLAAPRQTVSSSAPDVSRKQLRPRRRLGPARCLIARYVDSLSNLAVSGSIALRQDSQRVVRNPRLASNTPLRPKDVRISSVTHTSTSPGRSRRFNLRHAGQTSCLPSALTAPRHCAIAGRSQRAVSARSSGGTQVSSRTCRVQLTVSFMRLATDAIALRSTC